ncbi:hypothetical protein [Streptomyces sp. NPDC058757]|uniref:hypothetical protein n=1 Tax=Streptomyces sp. NPDC058757 TaxID=3346626 RepID=UPI0036BABE18
MADSSTTLWTDDPCRSRSAPGRRAPSSTTDDHAKFLYWRLKTGFVSEVLLGPPGSPLSFDTVVPGELLERPAFASRRGERTLGHVEDGRPTRSAGLQGIYRPAPASAAEPRRLVAGRFSGPPGRGAPAASGGRSR